MRSPDLIIVSGDIVHGISPDEPDPEKKLREQYREGLDFLSRLADRFVKGDVVCAGRSRRFPVGDPRQVSGVESPTGRGASHLPRWDRVLRQRVGNCPGEA